MNRSIVPALLNVTLAVAANAATLYWDGTGTSWNDNAYWSTDPAAATPDPPAKPGGSDVAVFSIDGVSGAQVVTLDADQAASKLAVRDVATGGVTLTGGGTDRALSLGAGGIEMPEGAGTLAIGSPVAGQGVAISLANSQTWTNGSANAIVIQNGIDAAGLQSLTLRGSGGFRLNGSSTFSGGVKTAAPAPTVYFGSDNAVGTGTFTSGGGTFAVEDFPVVLANKIKIDNVASRWSGDARLTLAGSGDRPAVAISTYANPQFNILRAAPLVVSGNWSLRDASSGLNNSGVGPRLHSGANVLIAGDIRENNAGNASGSENNGFNIGFAGTGADLAIYGNNLYGAGAANGAKVLVDATAGYNTLSLGGPGGPGAVVTPLGVAALYTNHGRGFFLKALVDGQIVTNAINTGASVNNDGGMPIGFDGDNDLTLAGVYAVAKSINFPNLADATLTFAGGVSSGGNTLTFQGPGATVFTSTSLIVATSGGIGKSGPGTLVLSGTNASGKLVLNGGSAVLDYTSHNSNRLGVSTNTPSALTLGGVDLQLKGGNYAQELGAGSGTTLSAGQSRIRRIDGGTSTIALGPIARATNSGSAIDFESGVASTTTATANGILGGSGYATVDKTDWAVGGGAIAALTAYDSFTTPGTDKNILVTASESVAGTSIGTLKIAPAEPGQSLTLSSGTLTVYRSGLLFTGPHDFTIGGGSIKCRGDYQYDLIVHQHGSGVLTLASQYANGNNSALVKVGDGTLVLANTNNTYAGATYLLGGVVAVAAPGSLGAGSMTMHGGTLRATEGFAYAKAVSLSSNGGTFDVVAGTLELGGTVSGNYGALNKTGAGTLLLSGVNSYNGPTTVSEGTLKLGSDRALGAASTNSNRAVSPVYVRNGATLDVAGRSAWIGNFTLVDGTVADSTGGGVLGAYSFTVENGAIDASLADVKVPNAANLSDSINLFKRSPGSVTLTAANTYSGTTFVDGGTLFVNGALPSSATLVRGGTLGGNGTLSRTVNVEDGGTLEPGSSATRPGTLTLGRHLRIDGGAFRVGIAGAAHGAVALTHPEAKVLLRDAALEVAILVRGAALPALTIIDNQGSLPVEGSFADLPEGSLFDADGRRFAITYTGGDGNDVVLNAKQTATLLLVR
jgi:fibronectin-binding autotransporter adhesin